MILCSSCNTECPDNANFCLNCGTSLKPNNQKQNQPEISLPVSNDSMTQALKRLMPKSYVEKLLASKGKMEGERRVVTILFSDVKGSTSLAEDLDPEEVLEVMNGAFNILIEPITQYEGTIARLMGDAILAFFGAPIAHEDDPYRACKAALDILQGAKNFSRKLELEKGIKGFDVRVGINTGLVVVAEVGTDLRVEYTAMGDAVNIAARMESAAKPGTILITESTKKLIQNDFELLLTGPITVKGKSVPINTYQVISVKHQEANLASEIKYVSPLIAREGELKTIEDAFNKLKNGVGGAISILGDSGIGKSRLVSEARKKQPSASKWVESRSLSYTSNNSYWTIRSLMKNFFGCYQESNEGLYLETINKKVISHFGTRTAEIYPYLEYFLSEPTEKTQTRATKFDDLRAAKGQFHYAINEFIKMEAVTQPLVIVWEDLQWCDSASLEILNNLLSLTIEVPLLLLLQYRLEENEARVWDFHHNALKEYKEKHTVISLQPLNEESSTLLINNLAGIEKLSAEIQNQIVQVSEGNPSFLEELVSSVLEQYENINNDTLSKKINIKDNLQLPGLLQNVIMSRVDCLEQRDKITLQTASVIGRVFPKKLLVSVMRESMPETEVEVSLKELQVRELILRHLPSNLSHNYSMPRKEYIFKQDLGQNVLYNSLLFSQRQALHRKVGEEIERLYSKNLDEFVDSLALHFERGKNFKKAVHYNKLSGDRAKELFANEDAIFFYTKSLTLSEGTQVEPLLLAKIQESLGDVYSTISDYSNSLNHFNTSLSYELDPTTKSRVYYKCGRVYERWGNYSQSLENYARAIELINQDDEKILAANIYSEMGLVYYRKEELAKAENLIQKALKLFNESGDDKHIAGALNNLGIIYGKLGHLDKSMELHEKSLEIRKQSVVSSGLAATYNNIGYLYQLKKNDDKAIEYYNKSLECCKKTGNLHGLAKTYDNLSHIFLANGKNELALDYNLKAISILGKIAASGEEVGPGVWLQSGVW